MRKCMYYVTKHYFSVPPDISPFSFSSDVVNEGIYAQVSCIVQSGDLPITITWSLKGDVISSEPGLMTAQIGQRASILSIDSVGYRHSGTYTCTARNEAGVASSSAELKVNGTRFLRRKPIFHLSVCSSVLLSLSIFLIPF